MRSVQLRLTKLDASVRRVVLRPAIPAERTCRADVAFRNAASLNTLTGVALFTFRFWFDFLGLQAVSADRAAPYGVSEVCKLDVRHGKGARGPGPRERMVPLINGAEGKRNNTDGSSRRVGDGALRGGPKDTARAHLPGGREAEAACPATLLYTPTQGV